MSFYATITRDDPNRIKRLIHKRRFDDALNLVRCDCDPSLIIDFGGGDGEFCRRLALRFPSTKVICFEPAEFLRCDAIAALANSSNAEVVGCLSDLPCESADIVFCMEVFEHLPETETLDSLEAINQLMRSDGQAIIGVPVEVFLPALFKGMFRMVRRYGEVDATVWNVVRASMGVPPRNRPVGTIADGLPYHFRHMGFDYRRFVKILRDRFTVQKTSGSPATFLPPWLNNEVYYVLAKTAKPTV